MPGPLGTHEPPKECKPVLRNHKLSHLLELKVDNDLFESRFAKGCATRNCNADCCRTGVWVDVEERNLILSKAEIVRRSMGPGQDKNPLRWFEKREFVDKDFPSGRRVGTRVRNHHCVFLDSHGRCVLQKTTIAEAEGKFDLKPFVCTAYPITIEDGTLTIDDEEVTARPQCCSVTPGGEFNVFDLCREELNYVLGAEGVQELRHLANEYSRRGTHPLGVH